MKLTIAKNDLMSSLSLTSHALGKDNWTTHYFVRKHTTADNKVEILSTNHRYCSSALAPCHLDGDLGEFTLEGNRVKQWLKNVSDGHALVLDSDGKVVNAKSARGSVRWACVDTDNFPYWDQALSGATSQCSVDANEFFELLSHAKNFVGKPEAKSLAFRYIRVEKGAVFASNGLSLSIVFCDKLKKANFCVTATDVAPLLGFLGKLEGDVEILSTDRIVFFKGSNEAIFGLTLPSKRSIAGLGTLAPDKYQSTLESSVGSWEATTKDLQQTIGLLESSMVSDDQVIKVSFVDEDSEKALALSAVSVTGEVDSLNVGLSSYIDEQGIVEKGQYLNKEIMLKVLQIIDSPTTKISVLELLNNSACLEHQVCGNTAYSVIVPLPNKTF